jgi:hypothetical protein
MMQDTFAGMQCCCTGVFRYCHLVLRGWLRSQLVSVIGYSSLVLPDSYRAPVGKGSIEPAVMATRCMCAVC